MITKGPLMISSSRALNMISKKRVVLARLFMKSNSQHPGTNQEVHNLVEANHSTNAAIKASFNSKAVEVVYISKSVTFLPLFF